MGAWLRLAAADSIDTSNFPPWLALLLSGIGLLGTAATAAAPVLVERVRASRSTHRGRRHDPDPPEPETPPPAAMRADAALDLVELAMHDLRAQRDDAVRRADRLQRELDDEQNRTAAQQVRIARLEAELHSSRGGMS